MSYLKSQSIEIPRAAKSKKLEVYEYFIVFCARFGGAHVKAAWEFNFNFCAFYFFPFQLAVNKETRLFRLALRDFYSFIYFFLSFIYAPVKWKRNGFAGDKSFLKRISLRGTHKNLVFPLQIQSLTVKIEHACFTWVIWKSLDLKNRLTRNGIFKRTFRNIFRKILCFFDRILFPKFTSRKYILIILFVSCRCSEDLRSQVSDIILQGKSQSLLNFFYSKWLI